MKYTLGGMLRRPVSPKHKVELARQRSDVSRRVVSGIFGDVNAGMQAIRPPDPKAKASNMYARGP